MIDEELLNAGVRFLPWEGDFYSAGLSGGQKLLVIGDSHYFSNGDRERAKPSITNELIQECVDGKGYVFFKEIHRVLAVSLAGRSSEQNGEFWTYPMVSFYNYLTCDQLTDGSGGQTRKMYTESETAMLAVLQDLKPTHVLILGRKVWGYFLASTLKKNSILRGEGRKVDWHGVGNNFDCIWDYDLGGLHFQAAHIYHPSSRGQFRDHFQMLSTIVHNFLDSTCALGLVAQSTKEEKQYVSCT